jgi:Na+-transporting NADH:ubiquinone oxidoreductase subunit NqrB
MIFGFIFILVGSTLPPLAFIFSIPCLILLHYLILVVSFFANLPFSAVFLTISWYWVFVYYLIIAMLVYFLRKRLKNSYL